MKSVGGVREITTKLQDSIMLKGRSTPHTEQTTPRKVRIKKDRLECQGRTRLARHSCCHTRAVYPRLMPPCCAYLRTYSLFWQCHPISYTSQENIIESNRTTTDGEDVIYTRRGAAATRSGCLDLDMAGPCKCTQLYWLLIKTHGTRSWMDEWLSTPGAEGRECCTW